MKPFILTFASLVLVLTSQAQQVERTASDEELSKTAASFLKAFYKRDYKSCLNDYDISYSKNDYLLLNNVEESITECQNNNSCLFDPDFEFELLHTDYRSKATPEGYFETITIYYAYTKKGYAFVSLSNIGKGWFISYINPQPDVSAQWNTRQKLEKIKSRKDR